jgi:RNA polymerase sigma-70 factor (ECF subfamily)
MTREDDRADADLLAAVAREPEAFGVFYARYSEAVFAYFFNRVQRSEIAADLTAETFASALAGARRYRADAPTAAPWLFGIARHKMIDSFRRGRVESEARRALGLEPLAIDDERLDAVERRIDFEQSEASVQELLAELPDAQREAILASVVDERSYAEIAADLECSEAVVRQRVSRGLRWMRARVGEQ